MSKKLPAESIPYDRIRDHYLDRENSSLSIEDQKILERWDFTDNLLRKFPRKKQIAGLLKERFKISTATAYNDIWYAQKLFGSVYTNDKDWWRNWMIEDGLVLIESAKAAGDRKTWAMERRNLIVILALDQKEEPKVNPEIFESNQIYTIIQMGDVTIKLDINTLLNMETDTRNKLLKALNQPITEIEAEQIMES
jgi:hypothetical protein